MSQSPLASEWAVLQNQYDSYEKCSLAIKLFAVGLTAAAVLCARLTPLIPVLLALLWLQDAIWKTFQGRMETRLLILEQYLADREGPASTDHKAFQHNTEFLAARPGTMGLVGEYLRQALRPTVAFPHLLLIIIAIAGMQS